MINALNLGCGCYPHKGWVNTDIEPMVDGVVRLDATQEFPFGDSTFNYVFSEHMIEHIGYLGAINMLTESYRVLKPNGVIRISMPSLDFLFEIYSHPNEHKDYIQWSFDRFVRHTCENSIIPETAESLSVFVINNFFKDWGHQFLFSYDILSELLTKIGFSSIKRCNISESEHEFLRNIEIHSQSIPKEFNELETICIEATKL